MTESDALVQRLTVLVGQLEALVTALSTHASPASSLLPIHPLFWTVAETAQACRRKPSTIRNLIRLHDLPVRRDGREPVRGRAMTRRVLLLSPATVDRLRRMTGRG